MKPNFSNKYASGIRKPRRFAETAFFGISTITSAICLAGIAMQFMNPGATFSSSPWLWALAVVVGFVIAYIADFVINQKIGRFAITEIIAWTSGYFEIPAMRKFNAVLFSAILAFGVFVSFVTSWDGARITASMAPAVTPPMLSSVMQTERQTLNAELTPYRKAVSDVEAKIKAQTDARTSGELQRLSKQGNAWAKAETAKIQAEVERQYRKELEAARASLAKVEERENKRTDKILSDAETKTKEATAKNEERTSVIWSILTFLGAVPLVFGVLLVVADCNETVLMQRPKVYARQATGKDPHQRSADDLEAEALYMNTNP